jgi:hypothetical protein
LYIGEIIDDPYKILCFVRFLLLCLTARQPSFASTQRRGSNTNIQLKQINGYQVLATPLDIV